MNNDDQLIISSFDPTTYKNNLTRNVVVVDVFRACSTVIALFLKGITTIICANNLKQAMKCYTGNEVLVGEKNGEQIKGFAFDNSPYQIMQMNNHYEKAILVTSGFSPAIVTLSRKKYVLAASLLNASAVSQAMLRIGGSWTLVCAAQGGISHTEDKICCALIAKEYLSGKTNININISHFIKKYSENFESKLNNSQNAKYLRKMNKSNDVEFIISQFNKYNIVPICKNDQMGNSIISFNWTNNIENNKFII